MKKIMLLILLVIIMSATGCIQSPTGQVTSEVTKIGVVATLTGVGAYQGQQALKGIQIALEEHPNIQIIVEDSKTQPNEAVTAVMKLVNANKVKYIIGDSWTSTTAVMVPVTNANDVILISPLATLNSLSQDDMFFRTMPKTNQMMNALANHAHKEGIRTVGILRQDTPFGVEHAEDFRTVFESLGGEIVGEEHFALSARDVRTEILKIKQKNPQAILNLHATGPMTGILIQQAKELGMDVHWLGSWGVESQNLIDEYGDVIEGMVYPYPYKINNENKFAEKYIEKYGEMPDLTAASSYDAMKVLVKAIQSDDVKKTLLETDYDGASGRIKFDKNGDVEKNILIKKVKNGEFIKI